PMAKWSMLLTGNYRCVLPEGVQAIRDAVHSDLELSQKIYGWVDDIAKNLGASDDDLVPFESYAKAAENLLKPSSVARAVDAGTKQIERVDRLVQKIGQGINMQMDSVDEVVACVDQRLAQNST
ncbi:MAG: hypothetical protein AAFW66_09155, partial [Pseudomonadota bacterium]